MELIRKPPKSLVKGGIHFFFHLFDKNFTFYIKYIFSKSKYRQGKKDQPSYLNEKPHDKPLFSFLPKRISSSNELPPVY